VINFTNSKALFVKIKKFADIWQFAAGSASAALAFAIRADRKNTREGTPEFGQPCIFIIFIFFYDHIRQL